MEKVKVNIKEGTVSSMGKFSSNNVTWKEITTLKNRISELEDKVTRMEVLVSAFVKR